MTLSDMAAALRQTVTARAAGAALVLTALAASAVSAAAPQVVGIAATVVNDVRIKGAASPQFRPAADRQRVALADQVQTGRSSRLQLLLLDKSHFTVGANARLTIDRFVYDPAGGSLTASVAKGAFRFMSGRGGSGRQAAIKSPAATIGIRGTLLDGVVGPAAMLIARGERAIPASIQSDPETATLVVLRGPGPRTQGNVSPGAVDVEAGGQTVTLDRPLQAAYVPYAGAQPIGPFTISLPGVARLNDLLLDPREILTDPNAPAQPYMAQPERERPFYDYPPPGAYGDGPGPRRGGGGSMGMPGIPGLNGVPNMPGRPDSPTRPTPPGRDVPQGNMQTPTVPDSTPPQAQPQDRPRPVPDQPSQQETDPRSGGRLYQPESQTPGTAPAPTSMPSPAPTASPTGSPNDPPPAGRSATKGPAVN